MKEIICDEGILDRKDVEDHGYFPVIAGKEKQESHGIFYGGFAFFS